MDGELVTRAPRYTPNTVAPIYISGSGIGDTHLQDSDERVRVWSANIPNTPKSPYSDTTLEGSESSLSDSVINASIKVTLAPPSPRYVYYRVYAEDGAMPSKRPVNANNSAFLGRIAAKSVAPPHTVASLKRRLCSVENIGDDTYSSLFNSTLSKSPLDDKARIAILSKTGPGLTQQEPMAFVVKSPFSDTYLLDSDDVIRPLLCEPCFSEPQYLYYRIYTDDGAISSKHQVESCDPSLGRIDVNFFTPPYTVASLKRCLTRAESINDHSHACLFMNASSHVPMGDSEYVSVLSKDGPGSLPDEPLVLVAKSGSLLYTRIVLSSPVTDSPYSEPRYLYYRVYTEYGEIPSKRAFDSDDPPLGRIIAKSIPPPHSVSSIKKQISAAEGFTQPCRSALFVDISDEAPLTEGYVSILKRDGPGSSPDKPMALVQSAVYTAFKKKGVALYGWVKEINNPQFLSLMKGEMLYTDGILRSEKRSGQVTATWGYQVLNTAGSLGFVMRDWIQFC